MSSELQLPIRQKLFAFLERDYQQDVALLNAQIGKSGDAGFKACMPPVPFAGNPFALESGNCIAIFGINPMWGGFDGKHGKNRLRHKHAIDQKRYSDFLAMRAEEFYENGPDGSYYGRYYTPLGKHLHREWFSRYANNKELDVKAAKEVFRRFVFKSDFLPWFSSKTDEIVAKNLLTYRIEAVQAHQELLSMFIDWLRPHWIQFNGSQMLGAISLVTEAELLPISIGTTRKPMYIRVGRSKRFSDTPVLVHGFVNSQGGPQTAEEFHRAAEAFEAWVGDDTVFAFRTPNTLNQ